MSDEKERLSETAIKRVAVETENRRIVRLQKSGDIHVG